MKIAILILNIVLLSGCARPDSDVVEANRLTNRIAEIEAQLTKQESVLTDLEDKIIQVRRGKSDGAISNLVVELRRATDQYERLYDERHNLRLESQFEIPTMNRDEPSNRLNPISGSRIRLPEKD